MQGLYHQSIKSVKKLGSCSGPLRGMSGKFEYLGELKFKFETNLGYESGDRECSSDEKTGGDNLTMHSL